jgi:site-specific DNA-methyltransferase (adenine-specific)
MTKVNLMLGDCLERMSEIPDASVDLVVTSPPYDNLRDYNGYSFEFEKIAKELTRVIKDGGVIVWVVGDATIKGSESGTSFRQALYFKDVCGLNLHDTMIYRKQNYIPLTHNRYEQEFEYMFVLSKGKPKHFMPIKVPCIYAGEDKSAGKRKFYKDSKTYGTGNKNTNVSLDKIKGNVWTYLVGNTTPDAKPWKHPAKFPLQLALDHIQSWSNHNDIVLDPFLGSGTAGVAALQLYRRFIGIEISEEYFKISQARIQLHEDNDDPASWETTWREPDLDEDIYG